MQRRFARWWLWGATFGGCLVAGCGEELVGLGQGMASTDFAAFKEAAARDERRNVYVVEGDMPIRGDKLLQEYYDSTHAPENGLTVDVLGGRDNAWSDSRKVNLTYCIAEDWGAKKKVVEATVEAAAQAWEAAAQIDFVHVATEDAACDRFNDNVLFDVAPAPPDADYLGLAFFPDYPRSLRTVFIAPETAGFVGLYMHELGHVLGLRHEHIRNPQDPCPEGGAMRPLTAYDSASTMHYPECNGTGDGKLLLTDLDKEGIRRLYGPALEEEPERPETEPCLTQTLNFTGDVFRGRWARLPAFSVAPGTVFRAAIAGTGDADLTVRFGEQPARDLWDCRPFLDGSEEVCELEVPADVDEAFVALVGWAARSRVTLEVTWSEPGAAADGVDVARVEEGTVRFPQPQLFGPYALQAGEVMHVDLADIGEGDADLYVRFAAPPSLNSFDCRPYLDRADESCVMMASTGSTEAYVMVVPYLAGVSPYRLSVRIGMPGDGDRD